METHIFIVHFFPKTNAGSPEGSPLFSPSDSITITRKKRKAQRDLLTYREICATPLTISLAVLAAISKTCLLYLPQNWQGPRRGRRVAFFFSLPSGVRSDEGVLETAPDFNEESPRNDPQKMFVYKSGGEGGQCGT